MRNKLPVYLDNMELPKDTHSVNDRENRYSYGYVSIMYLASIIITALSVLTVIFVGK